MATIAQIQAGAARFLDAELVPSFTGWQRVLIGGGAGLLLKNLPQTLAALAQNPMVAALGVIEGENIDVDAIYAELLKQAQKSSMTIDLPVIGPITFGTADVESLYRHVVGA